ncbi:hypothetical protein BDR03DRAFT_1014071 [Suillus americanus]|nr:hypothetical protein BDR03DRAFT_1014071 [Suillus americanus]
MSDEESINSLSERNLVKKQRGAGDSPTAAELADARRKRQQAKSTNALGANIRVPTLVALCQELHLDIGSLQRQCKKLLLKKDLLDILEEWRILHGVTDANGTLTSTEHDEGSIVLGRTILEEIWKDQNRLELPSFVSPAPNRVGSEKRKLSADCYELG